MNPYVIDIAGLTGLGAMGYGTFLIYEPAAYIVVGICLIAYAVKAGPNAEPKK